MIDHIGLDVTSVEEAKSFYRTALAPLGYGLVEEKRGWVGFGPPGKTGPGPVVDDETFWNEPPAEAIAEPRMPSRLTSSVRRSKRF